MTAMMPPPLPIARRTANGLVVDERPVRVAARWTDLPSRDGERFDVEWTGHVACVDTPADRALLSERLSAVNCDALDAARVGRMIVDEVRPAVARWVGSHEAAAMLDGTRDAELSATLETEARRVGFAAGLRVTAPFAVTIDSPTVRRAQDAARARRQLDALAADRAKHDADFDALRTSLADGDRAAAIRAATRVDGRDLLRAVAAADANWSRATPTLWIAAGDRLIAVDPTDANLSAEPIVVSGVGPIRSVRAAGDALLVGGRDGVAIVDREGRTLRTLSLSGGGDFGFNAACVLPATGEVLATHSTHGLVRWRGDRPAEIVSIGPAKTGGRALLAVADDAAVLLDGDGGLLHLTAGADAATPIGASASPIRDVAPLDGGHVAIVDADRNVAIVHPRDVAGGPITRTRVASPVAAITGVDLCGVPRVLVSFENGSAALVDAETGATTPIGDASWPARVVRSRPGFVAALGVDRSRVAIFDLSQPDARPTELHVATLTGRRVSDLWFA